MHLSPGYLWLEQRSWTRQGDAKGQARTRQRELPKERVLKGIYNDIVNEKNMGVCIKKGCRKKAKRLRLCKKHLEIVEWRWKQESKEANEKNT